MQTEDTSDVALSSTPSVVEDAAALEAARATQPWHRITLGIIVLVSAFLNLFRLDQVGYGNLYYAAAVKSMLQSWHNFFFVSFDPGGFVMVDKPPLGLWIQTASAKIFGFSGLSLLIPEALASVASVALLYYLVRKVAGPVAGLLAALALALMPISVVTARNNTADSLLVLTLLVATWALSRAADTGRLRWLLLCALIVGLGFNIKTLEAYLVVPALGLAYLLGTRLSWRKRILNLSLATVLLLLVSLVWLLAVDLTPASQRPYVGSSSTNSEINLTFGYNGLNRLIGGIGPGRQVGQANPPENTGASSSQGAGGLAQGGFGPDETGTPGVFRLFNTQLGGQISWLLPFALLGLLAACVQRRPQLPLDRYWRALVLWGTWLLTTGIFFSVASFYHTYYLVMLAPAICALVGIGAIALWRCYQLHDWRGWLLPVTLLVTAAVQVIFLNGYPNWSTWLSVIIGVVCVIVAAVQVVARLRIHLPVPAASLVIAGIVALLLAPTIWSIVSVIQGSNSSLPTAGPTRQGSGRGLASLGNSGGFGEQADPKLFQYLEANQGNTRYLLATTNANSAAPIIISTGKPVMALGGFLGSDPILTPQKLAALVKDGTVRYFMLPSSQLNNLPPALREYLESHGLGNGGGFGGPGGGENTQWVTSHCKTVPTDLYSSTNSSNGSDQPPFGNGQPPFGGGSGSGQPPFGNGQPPFGGGPGGGNGQGQPSFGGGMQQQLYDCAGAH